MQLIYEVWECTSPGVWSHIATTGKLSDARVIADLSESANVWNGSDVVYARLNGEVVI